MMNRFQQVIYKRYNSKNVFLVVSVLVLSIVAIIWFFIERWRLYIVQETELPVAAIRGPSRKRKTKNADGETPLQPIQTGEGKFYNRTYQVDITHPHLNKMELFQSIIDDINWFTPQEMAHFVKTKGNTDRWQAGDEFLVQITGPWNGPVRLADLQETSFLLVTLEGHMEAGEIQFSVIDHPEKEDALRFEISSWARSSNHITDFFYQFLGVSKFSQARMWTFFCDKVVEKSGGQLIGKINVMTHKASENPTQSESTWKQYSSQFDHWKSVELNFDPTKQEEFTEVNGWHIDDYKIGLPSEPVGEPIPGGAWEVAKGIVNNYEFPDPGLISGIFLPDAPLKERIMIVKAHFLMFTFLFGVRISQVIDETRDGGKRGQARVWGYGYQTLTGHFEMGEIIFEVWKFLETGDVEFRMHAYSKPAAISNPFYQLGFRLFGRSLQKRFGASSLERMQRLVLERIASTPEPEKPLETPDVKPISKDEDAGQKVEEINQNR
jgi:uncharacterized protein (UPF0548 family)